MNDSSDIFILKTDDEEAIHDLSDFFYESYETCERNLSTFAASDDKPKLIDEMFRSVHTIKSHATVCEIEPIIHFCQVIEDVIYGLKSNRLEFDDLLCDAILMSMDRLKELIMAIIEQAPMNSEGRKVIEDLLSKIASSKGNKYLPHAQELIDRITGQFVATPETTHPEKKEPPAEKNPEKAKAPEEPKAKAKSSSIEPELFTADVSDKVAEKESSAKTEPTEQASKIAPGKPEEMSKEGTADDKEDQPKPPPLTPIKHFSKSEPEDPVKEDLDFFRALGHRVDEHNPDWTNRTEQQLELSLELNRRAGLPIDPGHLTAAVCLHDIGMAFVPSKILFKEGRLDADELKEVQKHPFYGAELVRRMTNWHEVSNMIMQHHEKLDGTGYPNGVGDDTICDGARILAIVDAYYAMTNFRADRKHKRSRLRAISEINACIGTQFCSEWVKIFNSIMLDKKTN